MAKPKILIVGSGLVGSAIARLIQIKFSHLIHPILVDASPLSYNTRRFLKLKPQEINSILNQYSNQKNIFSTRNFVNGEMGTMGTMGTMGASDNAHGTHFENQIQTLRTSALAPSSIELLNKMVANDDLRELLWKSGRYYHGMSVWDGAVSNLQNRYAAMHFPTAYGWIGPNEIIQNVIVKEMQEDGLRVTHASVKKIIPIVSNNLHNNINSINNINNISNASSTSDNDLKKGSVGLKEGKSLVTLQYFSEEDPKTPVGQEELEVDLIIGCDGAMSNIRQVAGIPFVHHEYEQRAFVTTVKIDNPNLNLALQRFIPTGPIALLPIGEGICNVVWSTTPEQAHYLQSLDDKELVHALNVAFHEPCGGAPIESYYHDVNIVDRISSFASSILDDFSPTSQIEVPTIYDIVPNQPIKKGSFPLRQIHAKKYVKNGIVLAGDAAHAVHPLAGQGVNLGFADAAQLMKAFDVAVGSGMKLSSEIILQQEYEKVRFRENEIHIQFFNAVKQLFSIPHETVGLMRGIGMFGINNVPLINKKIQQLASNKMDISHIPQSLRKEIHSGTV